jgi:hypothetical protein
LQPAWRGRHETLFFFGGQPSLNQIPHFFLRDLVHRIPVLHTHDSRIIDIIWKAFINWKRLFYC